MTTGYSLRRRLVIGLSVSVTALWLIGTAVSAFVVRHELDEAFDSALQETAQRILPLAVIDVLEQGDTGTARRISPLSHQEEYLIYILRRADGTVLLHSHNADPAVFPETPSTGFRDSGDHRIYGESAVSGSYILEVAEPLSHRREATMESSVALLFPLLILLPIGLFGLFWLTRRGLAPVLALCGEIGQRGSKDLSPIAGDGLPEEVQPIVTSVNELLGQLSKSLAAERAFAANSAHELRTPIAGALAQTQRLRDQLDSDDLRLRADGLEASLKRIQRISEKLMQLARAEGAGVLSANASDLRPILDHLVESYRRDHDQAARIDYRADQPHLMSRLDPDSFGILVGNLIENALKHSDPGSIIRITLNAPGEIQVENDAAPIAPDDLARLKDPFARGGSTAEGSGLGLAIAHTIAEAAGANLAFLSPSPGRDSGFTARLDLAVEPS